MEGIKKSGLTLAEAQTITDAYIADVKNGFIGTGYSLKIIRDERLWQEKYESFDIFMCAEYEKDKSWASKCISVYEMFGEILQPGELPKLADAYTGYNVGQLIELVSLPEEKWAEVTPKTTVREIRKIKPKHNRKVATVATFEKAEEADQGPLSAYGTPKTIQPEGSLLSTPGCDGGHDCFNCHVECDIRQEYCYCVEAPMGIPFPCTTLDMMENLKCEIGGRCQFVDNSLAYHQTGDKEPVPCCKECKESCQYACERAGKAEKVVMSVKVFNTELTGCIHREGYGCTLIDENKTVPGDGNVCSCCWDCKYHGMCHFECNASAGRSGEWPVFDAAWFVKKWREIRPDDFQRAANACDIDGAMSAKAKAIQETISPYGSYCIGCSEWKFDFHGFAGGMDFKVGKESIHLKYGRLANELMELKQEESSIEGLRGTVIVKEEESQATVAQEPEPEEPTVIDAEYIEVSELPKEEYTLDYFLKEQNQKLNEFLKVEGIPCIVLERQKMIVCALGAMKADLEIEESKRTYKPELPLLKNNDQRAAFVDAYETWPLWIEIEQTGERYYRYDLPDEASMVVKVYHTMLFDYKAEPETKYEDRFKEGYGNREYYLLQDGKFFRDCDTNRSILIEKLKEIQRKEKGE